MKLFKSLCWRELQKFRVGESWRFRRNEIDNWITEQSKQGSEDE